MEISKKQFALAVFTSGMWMNVSEFIRNELIIKQVWVAGFENIGLSFPSAPMNGAIWGLWAFIFVAFLTWLITKFDILKSTIISWTFGFVLLWIAMRNMGILPKGLLIWAIPWSFIEVYIAAFISKRILYKKV